MEVKSLFVYRERVYDCEIFTDISPDPCFIFIVLNDPGLIARFGTDLIIKTDYEKVLPLNNDHDELAELRQAIFNAIITFPEIINARLRKIESTLVEQLSLGDTRSFSNS